MIRAKRETAMMIIPLSAVSTVLLTAWDNVPLAQPLAHALLVMVLGSVKMACCNKDAGYYLRAGSCIDDGNLTGEGSL